MSDDARVKSAIAHWAPRFIANGVALADFQEVTAGIKVWDDWCKAWCDRAALHEEMGREALATKKFLTAGEHLQRAAVYYHFAKFMFVNDVPQMKAAHMRAVKCKQDSLPYLTPPGERVAIPFEGKTLYGILRKPPGVAKPKVMVMACGLDSTKEETEAYERPFLARGVAILCFDGPGQGEAEYDMPIRGDYEKPVKAVIDYIETRDDLDWQAGVGMWGVSFGGYYAPRAAAFEKRIKAAVVLAGPYDVLDFWDNMPELTREAFRVRSHCKTVEEAKKHAATLSLKGVAEKITCPLIIVTGKLDRVIRWQDSERLAREAKGPIELMIIEDGNHVANNRGYKWRLKTADWMAEQLGVTPLR